MRNILVHNQCTEDVVCMWKLHGSTKECQSRVRKRSDWTICVCVCVFARDDFLCLCVAETADCWLRMKTEHTREAATRITRARRRALHVHVKHSNVNENATTTTTTNKSSTIIMPTREEIRNEEEVRKRITNISHPLFFIFFLTFAADDG